MAEEKDIIEKLGVDPASVNNSTVARLMLTAMVIVHDAKEALEEAFSAFKQESKAAYDLLKSNFDKLKVESAEEYAKLQSASTAEYAKLKEEVTAEYAKLKSEYEAYKVAAEAAKQTPKETSTDAQESTGG